MLNNPWTRPFFLGEEKGCCTLRFPWPMGHGPQTSAARMKGSQDPSPQSAADSVSCQVGDEDWGFKGCHCRFKGCTHLQQVYIYIMLYICYIYKYINLRAYAAYVIMLTYMNIYIYMCSIMCIYLLQSARSTLSFLRCKPQISSWL